MQSLELQEHHPLLVQANDDNRAYRTVYHVLTTLCLLTLGVESWILYKVVKVADMRTHPYFAIMLACLHFSLIFSVVFFQL